MTDRRPISREDELADKMEQLTIDRNNMNELIMRAGAVLQRLKETDSYGGEEPLGFVQPQSASVKQANDAAVARQKSILAVHHEVDKVLAALAMLKKAVTTSREQSYKAAVLRSVSEQTREDRASEALERKRTIEEAQEARAALAETRTHNVKKRKLYRLDFGKDASEFDPLGLKGFKR